MKRAKLHPKRVRMVPRHKLLPARQWRLLVGHGCTVELRVSRNRRCMHEAMRHTDGDSMTGAFEAATEGLCRYFFSRRTREHRVLLRPPNRAVARIYLNTRDLAKRPSELVAHECTHAAMAWARYRKADVYENGFGEEVLAHAVGRLVKQANHALYAMGVFP